MINKFRSSKKRKKINGTVEQAGEDKVLALKPGVSPASMFSSDAELGTETAQLHFFLLRKAGMVLLQNHESSK